MNVFNCVGRIGADPEAKGQGDQVVTTSLAVTRPFKNKLTGQYDADWFNLSAYGERNKAFMLQHLKRGDMVGVSGEIRIDKPKEQGAKGVYVTLKVNNIWRLQKGNNHF